MEMCSTRAILMLDQIEMHMNFIVGEEVAPYESREEAQRSLSPAWSEASQRKMWM